MTTRAVTYLRVSDDLDGRSTSIDQQRHEVAAFLEARGWAAVAEEVDSDISASRYSRKARPGWRRVLDLLDDGGADAIVAWDLDRLLRQPRELEDLIDRAEKGLPVHTLGGGDLNLASGDGRFVARILVAKSAKESDDLSRRVRRSKAAIARNGGVMGSVRAFGWEPSVPKGVTGNELNGMRIIDVEAEAIRDAAARVLAGASLSSVARDWNDRELRRPRGASRWSATTIRDVLTSPRNAGLIQHRGEVVGEAAWPAILDRVTFERLTATFNDPARKTGPRRRNTFSGVFRCGVCGHVLMADSSGGKRVWRCRTSTDRPDRCGTVAITGHYVEPVVVEWVLRTVDSPGFGVAPRPSAGPADEAVTAELVVVERRLDELAEMWAAGEIGRREWITARDRVEARRAALAASLANRETSRVLAPYVGTPGVLRAEWPTMPAERQNLIILSVLDGARIAPAGPEHASPADRMMLPDWRG